MQDELALDLYHSHDIRAFKKNMFPALLVGSFAQMLLQRLSSVNIGP